MHFHWYTRKECRILASKFCILSLYTNENAFIRFHFHSFPDKTVRWQWINQLVLLGAMDQYSLHGGCDIRKGVKWMANNWLTAPPAKYKDWDSLYSLIDPEGAF